MRDHIPPDGEAFFSLIDTYLPEEDRRRVREAFKLARQEHGDERRRSGELFFTHPLIIAYHLAEYQLDGPALVAALLHDVVEDTRVSVREIEDQFGKEVSRLVDGLTKFEAVADDAAAKKLSAEEVRDATLHKLFGVMTTDVRVGIIKLFDRLHNMSTIRATPPDSQRRKAKETLAVYAPLANRLGMWQMRNQLAALSIEVLDEETYQAITQRQDQLRHQQQAAYATISQQIAARLTTAGLQIVDIFSSPESVYSIYQLSTTNGQGAHVNVDPTLRIVVLLDDVPSCYMGLGEIHQMWRPVPGTFDDYIAVPRDNLYRSLHTTVIHESGRRVKVRFRTAAMNVLSEIGVLARWIKIGMPLWSPEIADRVEALFANISENINLEPHDPTAGVQGVVEDIFRRNQIMVYTPAGDVKELPQGATPLDFAYTIHTEVGAQCRAAFVNDEPTPLNRPLQDGDRVHIIKRGRAPQRIWLDEDLGYITTSRARTRVRRWFRRLRKNVAVREGRRLLEDELTMLGMEEYPHPAVADMFGYERPAGLYHALGRAEILPTAVSTRVLSLTWQQGPVRDVDGVVTSDDGERFVITNAGGRPLRLCRNCQPRPGDSIIGFARKDGGVTVHKENCHTTPLNPISDRILKLGWGADDTRQVRLITVKINVYDRAGLLFEIAELIQNENINMPAVYAHSKNGEAELVLDMEAASPRQLVRVLHRIYALTNVFSVVCLSPGARAEIQP